MYPISHFILTRKSRTVLLLCDPPAVVGMVSGTLNCFARLFSIIWLSDISEVSV